MILIDRQIADLCRGIVPDELRFFYSFISEDVPRKVRPMVSPFLPEMVQPASLDVRVGNSAELLRCRKVYDGGEVVDYEEIDLSIFSESRPYQFCPGDRALVATLETFCLPNFLKADFHLKSTNGRQFYQHIYSGFCDPGWNHSVLTMELINLNLKPLPLYPGMAIGQLVFDLTLGTPDRDYSVVGRYNGDKKAQRSKS
ncbi:MAG: hypothetical protein RLZZ490_1473 [Cyanobacteriota bacterium]|jgi:dCTP deaminase